MFRSITLKNTPIRAPNQGKAFNSRECDVWGWRWWWRVAEEPVARLHFPWEGRDTDTDTSLMYLRVVPRDRRRQIHGRLFPLVTWALLTAQWPTPPPAPTPPVCIYRRGRGSPLSLISIYTCTDAFQSSPPPPTCIIPLLLFYSTRTATCNLHPSLFLSNFTASLIRWKSIDDKADSRRCWLPFPHF